MFETVYRPGSACQCAVTERGLVLLVDSHDDGELIDRAWRALEDGTDAAGVFSLLVRGFGSDPAKMPAFAIALVAEAGVRVAVRGAVDVRATTATGEVHIDGTGFATWAESVLTGVSTIHVIPQGHASSEASGGGGRPLRSGVVVADAILLMVSAEVPERSDGVPERSDGVPERSEEDAPMAPVVPLAQPSRPPASVPEPSRTAHPTPIMRLAAAPPLIDEAESAAVDVSEPAPTTEPVPLPASAQERAVTDDPPPLPAPSDPPPLPAPSTAAVDTAAANGPGGASSAAAETGTETSAEPEPSDADDVPPVAPPNLTGSADTPTSSTGTDTSAQSAGSADTEAGQASEADQASAPVHPTVRAADERTLTAQWRGASTGPIYGPSNRPVPGEVPVAEPAAVPMGLESSQIISDTMPASWLVSNRASAAPSVPVPGPVPKQPEPPREVVFPGPDAAIAGPADDGIFSELASWQALREQEQGSESEAGHRRPTEVIDKVPTFAAPSPVDVLTMITCPAGHGNPVDRVTCWVCGAAVSGPAVELPRVHLGEVLVSTGPNISLAEPCIIGRRPTARPQDAPQTQLITVPSPNKDVSRNHLAIRPDGWRVLAEDLQATNGTIVHRTGEPPRRLAAGEVLVVRGHDVLDMGEGVVLTFGNLP